MVYGSACGGLTGKVYGVGKLPRAFPPASSDGLFDILALFSAFLPDAEGPVWKLDVGDAGSGNVDTMSADLCPFFFNPKDLPFLSLYILGSYSLFLFWLRPGIGTGLFHGLACGMLIAMRVTGIILPAVTIFLIALDLLLNKLKKGQWYLKYGVALFFYVPALLFFTILFWPYLWEQPWQHFQDTFKAMAQYGWTGKALFRGQFLAGKDLPWYYIIYWMGITIPLVFLLFAVCGIAQLGRLLFSHLKRASFQLWEKDEQRKDWGMLALLLAPLAAIIVKDAIVYDGWRHLFLSIPVWFTLLLTVFIICGHGQKRTGESNC